MIFVPRLCEKSMENKKPKRKGGQPKHFVSEMKRLHVYLPEPVYEAIGKLASEQYPPTSANNLMTLALLQFLERRGATFPDPL
jgi:hypothetical protein